MTQPDDGTTPEVLAALGVAPDARLGSGGEAVVYALDDDRVLRVHRRGTRSEKVAQRDALLAELAVGAAAVPFAIPRVLETTRVAGQLVTIEVRLPGTPLMERLNEVGGGERALLIRAYLEAAARIGDLTLARDAYGDLMDPRPVRSSTFRGYLRERARRNLAAAGSAIAADELAEELAGALPEPSRADLVHLDVFPGNVLVEGSAVTAVLDFGTLSIMGDRRLDPLTATIYLDAPITPAAIDADRRTALDWLQERELITWYAPARRWLGAFWSPAPSERLSRWGLGQLGAAGGGPDAHYST